MQTPCRPLLLGTFERVPLAFRAWVLKYLGRRDRRTANSNATFEHVRFRHRAKNAGRPRYRFDDSRDLFTNH